MKVLKFAMLAVVAVLSGLVGRGAAQEAYHVADSNRTVTLTETSFNHLISRLEALEATLGDTDGAKDGWKEVDVLEKPTQKWSGRVHFDYWPMPDDSPLPNFLETGDPADGPDDFIGFRRLRFGVRGQVNETMEYKIEMEFASPTNLALKDAYLGWNELPFLHTVLLGNQKRPYGLDHLNSSRYNVFMERPFHVEAFNQDARRFGIQSYGLSEDESWNWRWGYFVMDDLQNAGFQRTDNYQSEVAGRVANTIWYDECSDGRGYAHWAVSGSLAFPGGGPDGRFRTRPEARTDNRWLDTGSGAAGDFNNYQLIGVEGVLNFGALSIVGEYQHAFVDRTVGNNVDFGGGYVYVAYWLTGEHTPWERFSGTLGRTKPLENFFLVRTCDGGIAHGWGAWQIAARYSYADFTDDNIFGGVGESLTIGANWWWNPYARVQFNYINGQIRERSANNLSNDDPPYFEFVNASGSYDIFGMRFMVDF